MQCPRGDAKTAVTVMQILAFQEDLLARASLQLLPTYIWGAAGLLLDPYLWQALVEREGVDGEEIWLDGEGN